MMMMMMMDIQVRWREGSLFPYSLIAQAFQRCQLASSDFPSGSDIYEWTGVNFDLTRIAYFSLFVILCSTVSGPRSKSLLVRRSSRVLI